MLREVCLHRGAVIVLPLLESSPEPKIVMIRNHRHSVCDTLLELPAGTLEYKDVPGTAGIRARPGDPTEDPGACGARELTEETGYRAEKIRAIGWFYTSPGILTEKMYAFVATGLTAGTQALEENEEIQTEVLSRSEILRLIGENVIVDAKSIATLLKYFVGTA